jgi:FixJ family two-component response regulator
LRLSDNPISVYIVDDDDGVRRALARLFKSAGIQSRQFSSAREFLAEDVDSHRACVIADLNIAGDEPTELPGQLRDRQPGLPVIFVSADDTDANRARVRAVGGLGLYRKPVDSQALIDAIRWAVEGQESTN